MLHHHSGGAHQNVATGPGTMAASTFSLFFPPPPNKGQWPPSYTEEAAYSYDEAHSTVTTTSPSSPASSSSWGSVDCTLSLGTPSSRRRAPEPDMTMPRQSVSALPWDAPVAESCYYLQQQGRHVAGAVRCAAGHDTMLDRRCANCGTSSTPLWRNGPRGPKSLCNACGIRFKKEERRAAETGAGAFYGTQRVAPAPMMKAPRAASSYAEVAQPCGGDPDAPFLAWRLSAVPPAPAFAVWPERHQASLYQYN